MTTGWHRCRVYENFWDGLIPSEYIPLWCNMIAGEDNKDAFILITVEFVECIS